MLYSIALYIALLTFTINRIARLGSKSTAVDNVEGRGRASHPGTSANSGNLAPVDVNRNKVLVEV